jgi:hypothetical protein
MEAVVGPANMVAATLGGVREGGRETSLYSIH